jgi:LPS-assembly protein
LRPRFPIRIIAGTRAATFFVLNHVHYRTILRVKRRLNARYHFILLALAPASGLYAAGCPVDPYLVAPPPGVESGFTADSASFTGEDAMIARGDVRLERGDQALEAPMLRYERAAGRVLAAEGLRYHRPGLSLRAEYADIRIDARTGVFENADFALIESGGRGHADRIESLDGERLRLLDTDYSTCAGDDKAWRLTANRIELDRGSGRGEAFGTVLRIRDWPVFYSPYLNFPIDDRRHTGFLTPTLGHSGKNGLELATPYYFNLAPERDATLTPRLLEERGLQLAGEFRYLSRRSRGEIAGEYLPDDDVTDDDRSLLSFRHEGRLTPRWAVAADYTRVSDDRYFEDLDNTLARSAQSQLERSLWLTAARPGVRFSLLAQAFQTLEDDRGDFGIEPYRRLPQARLSLLSPTHPWRAGLDAEFTSFRHDQTLEGLRYDLRPNLGWGIDRGGWYAEAGAAYRYTRYDLDLPPGDDTVVDRGLPSFTAETGLRFARRLDNGWVQTLEPRAFYLYTGYQDQDALPLFDTGVPDLHFERLFADNRFVGADRVGDANQATLAITSRFLDPASGRTLLKLDLGRIYGFRELRVHLPQRPTVGYGDRHSDLVANVEAEPWHHWHAGATATLDPDRERADRVAMRMGYRGEGATRVILGYRFYRDFRPDEAGTGFETLEQTDVSAVLPITARWKLIGRWNYSLDRRQSVETLAGLAYRPSCCWAVRAAWRRYLRNDQSDYDTAIMLQIELTGLGRFGDDIESELDRGMVTGYPD